MPNRKTEPTHKPPQEILLTVAEVATLDNCSARTVRRAIAAGLLRVIRIGPGKRSIRISKAAHERYRDLLAE